MLGALPGLYLICTEDSPTDTFTVGSHSPKVQFMIILQARANIGFRSFLLTLIGFENSAYCNVQGDE